MRERQRGIGGSNPQPSRFICLSIDCSDDDEKVIILATEAGRQAAGRLARRREAAQKQRSPCLPLERVLVFDAPTRGLPPDTMHAMPTATREAGRGGGATDGCLGASPIFRGARQPCEDFRRAHRRKTGGGRASSTGVHHESSLTAEPPPAARGTLGNRARHSTANQGSDF